MPIVVSPFGLDKLFHPDGHCAVRTRRGAGKHGRVRQLVVGLHPRRGALPASPEGAAFFQVSALGPVSVVDGSRSAAADAGYTALCVCVDTPRPGSHERTLEDTNPPSALELASANYGPDDYADRLKGGVGWTWDTVAAVAESGGISWLAKGVLTAADAHLAVEHGARAVVVSNHGGRQLDGAPASLDALPEVVDAVAGACPCSWTAGFATVATC